LASSTAQNSSQPPGSKLDPALVAYTDPRSAAAEAYRALRTNIQFASPDKPLKTLLATSTSPEDGKSTTLANLAITLAETGARTLLVDCDLRRPAQHALFGLSNDIGLTSLMLGTPGTLTPDRLGVQATPVANLGVLTSGPVPPNPAELLASRRMAEILTTLAGLADYVLFDAPPIIAVTDAAILAPRVDGVLLIVRAGKTKRDLAIKARRLLEQVNAPLVGVVLNDATMDRNAYGYYGK
jgi:capsular exopolysaccharide synthesis family protein